LPVQRAKGAVGCAKCDSTGYRGRIVLAEMLPIDRPEIAAAMLARRDADALGHLAEAAGMTTLWKQAIAAVEAGDTSPAEVRRVLGMRDNPG
jgi:type II secretory ATPase GspE/PulE/Tfp pilus assembly ATPase PilB-like protein